MMDEMGTDHDDDDDDDDDEFPGGLGLGTFFHSRSDETSRCRERFTFYARNMCYFQNIPRIGQATGTIIAGGWLG